MHTLLLYSPHPPEVCAEKLAAMVDLRTSLALPSFRSADSTRQVVGVVNPSSLHLGRQSRHWNSLPDFLRSHGPHSFLKATCTADGPGTRIAGRFSDFPIPEKLVLFLALAIPLGILGTALARLHFGWADTASSPRWLGLVPLALLSLPVLGGCVLGRHQAREEAAFLREFLIQALDARESAIPAPAPPQAAS